MKYRPEIDGLRTVAVVPVILFHAGFKNLSGGFLGVDIFFVISGFLITTILINELHQDRFSLVKFYERRARRILPALTVMVIATTFAAWVLMPANLMKNYSQSVVSVGTFLSNFYFYLTSGYFSTLAEEKPLLHTWSLAVEEQYYVFFPLVLMFFWSKGIRVITLIIAAMLVGSLALNVYLIQSGYFDFSFYSIFTRAWELFVGSMLAIYIYYKGYSERQTLNQSISVLGFIMIIFAYIYIDKRDAHPGLITLIPVLGTAMVIFAATPTNWVGKLLSTKLFVAIGLISYSLYLWHQPLFAFVKMKTFGGLESLLLAISVVLTFVLAILSYFYVEKPFRNRTTFDAKRVFSLSAYALVLMSVFGFYGHFSEGIPTRFDSVTNFAQAEYSPYRDTCHTSGLNYLKPADACEYGGDNISWAVFGDSHVVEPAFAISNKLGQNDIGIKHFTFSGCPPLLDHLVHVQGCTKWMNEALNYIVNSKSISTVYLGFRYSSFLFGDQLLYYPDVPNRDPHPIYNGSKRVVDSEKIRSIYWTNLEKVITSLLASGKQVIVQLPIPELPTSINKAITPISIFSQQPLLDISKTTTVEYFRQRHEFILQKFTTLEPNENLTFVDPTETLCKQGYCSAVIDDNLMYFDDNHLSNAASALLIDSNIGVIFDNKASLTNSAD